MSPGETLYRAVVKASLKRWPRVPDSESYFPPWDGMDLHTKPGEPTEHEMWEEAARELLWYSGNQALYFEGDVIAPSKRKIET